MSYYGPTRLRIRQGSVLNLVLIGVLFVVILGVGTWAYLSGSGTSNLDEPLTAKVTRGLFIKEVLDQGEIQSSDFVEVRCKVKSRYGSRGVTVKRVVEEGTLVNEGDFLIELRSDEIKENLDKQNMAVNNANDSKIAAENNLAAAKIALLEYEEGKFLEELEVIENRISEATEELATAQEYLKFSEQLQARNYITRTELRSDEAKLLRAKRALTSALNSKKVLIKYTKVKTVTELQTNIKIAESKLAAAIDNLKIEEDTLEEIKEQQKACYITVPEGESGQVVYANIFSRRGNSEFVLEEGASVREGQVLIKLPKPRKMRVKATVNESRITSIDEEMSAKVSVDALNGKEFEGIVTKVNEYAEPEGWGGGGVRKYGVFIDIVAASDALKPGMNSSVLIETERLENALQLPIQCVYGYRGKTFCLVKKADSWETVEIKVGSNNDTNVVVKSGLEEGDDVAMNPAAFKQMLNLPDLPEVEEGDKKGKRNSKKRDGKKQGNKRKSEKSSDKKKDGGDKKASEKDGAESSSSAEPKSDTKESRSKNSPGGSVPNPNKKKDGDKNSGPNNETAKKPAKTGGSEKTDSTDV